MEKQKIESLISLIDDPDEGVFELENQHHLGIDRCIDEDVVPGRAGHILDLLLALGLDGHIRRAEFPRFRSSGLGCGRPSPYCSVSQPNQ